MGFGLLFLGYFMTFLMSVNQIGFLFRLAGYVLMLYACMLLRKYNRYFTLPMYLSISLIVISAGSTVVGIWNILYEAMLVASKPSIAYEEAFTNISAVLVFVFHLFLLGAIRKIAIETDMRKIADNAVRNFIFICVYYLMYIVSILPFFFTGEYIKYFSLPITLLYFAWIILNLVLIFSCYSGICDENDVEMRAKPSRFAFVNKFRRKMEEREERAVDEAREYAKQRREKKGSGRNKRGK